MSQKEIKMTELAMNYIQSSLEKSRCDSSEIYSRLVKDDVETKLLYYPHLNRDSLQLEVVGDSSLWDSYLEFKQLAITNDGTYILNGRYIGESFSEFKLKIINCSELTSLSQTERVQFANYFYLLNQNNVWDCVEYELQINRNIYLFSYSKENIFISSRTQRYLTLKSTSNLSLLRQKFEILDERGGVLLIKEKLPD